MKKFALHLLALLCALSCAEAGSSAIPDGYVIGFYNVENLFDAAHDKGKNDYDFLPDGANGWTAERYARKRENIASVIRAMKEENGAWHTLLGLAEVENDQVLEDLLQEPSVAEAGYEYVHFEGPDRRGIDCALLYRPQEFTLLEKRSIPYDFDSPGIRFEMTRDEMRNFRTRDVLMVRGKIAGEMVAVFVAHLPSRKGEKAEETRARGAEIIHENALALMQKHPGIKIVVMGDMNDDPEDRSQTEYLHAKATKEETGAADFYSPFISTLRRGIGTLTYHGDWNLFDIILVNQALADAPAGSLHIVPCVAGKYDGCVFKKPFMTQQEGKYKGSPKRTFSGETFLDGYSDHYPTYIVISNK